MSEIDLSLTVEARRLSKPRSATMPLAKCFDEAGRESSIRVRNLSETGLGGKISAGPLPPLNELVALVFRGEKRYYGRVVWIADGQVGIAFDLPFNMGELEESWSGPQFQLRDLHKNLPRDARRPALKPL